MQDDDMRCARCGAVLVPGSWWQINVSGEPVCEPCVAHDVPRGQDVPREYDRGR